MKITVLIMSYVAIGFAGEQISMRSNKSLLGHSPRALLNIEDSYENGAYASPKNDGPVLKLATTD